MRRTTTILVAALVVVGTLAAVPATGLAQTATTDDGTDTPTPTPSGEDAENETDENATAPGDLLEGVIGVQEAEVEGEIENRTFGIRVAQAATAEAKADVVAEQLQRNEERIAELEERREELNESRENGTISEAEYRNEIARLAVESRNAERLTNRTANTSEELPAELLEEKGINATAIRTLAERADQLTGPEVAEIARSIAGPSVADEAADGAAERRGPPEDADATAGSGDRGGADDRSGNATADGDRGTERPDDAADGSGSDGTDAADDGSDTSDDSAGGSGDSGSDGGASSAP